MVEKGIITCGECTSFRRNLRLKLGLNPGERWGLRTCPMKLPREYGEIRTKSSTPCVFYPENISEDALINGLNSAGDEKKEKTVNLTDPMFGPEVETGTTSQTRSPKRVGPIKRSMSPGQEALFKVEDPTIAENSVCLRCGRSTLAFTSDGNGKPLTPMIWVRQCELVPKFNRCLKLERREKEKR
jgi:hypothetical protein